MPPSQTDPKGNYYKLQLHIVTLQIFLSRVKQTHARPRAKRLDTLSVIRRAACRATPVGLQDRPPHLNVGAGERSDVSAPCAPARWAGQARRRRVFGDMVQLAAAGGPGGEAPRGVVGLRGPPARARMMKADGGPLDDGGGNGEMAHSARFFGRNAAGDTASPA